jgi:hypothetical protein
LSTFLENALSSPNRIAESSAVNPGSLSIPTWYLVPSFTSYAAYESFDRLAQPILSGTSSLLRYWKEDVDFEADDENFVGSFELLNGSLEKTGSMSDLLDTSKGVLHGEVDQDHDILFISVRESLLKDVMAFIVHGSFLPVAFSTDTASNFSFDLS